MWKQKLKQTHQSFIKCKNYDAMDMITQQKQILKEEEEAEVTIPLNKYIELKEAKIKLDKLKRRKR